jgi:O-antigen/teichoic acid export membrane protein
VGQAFAVDLPGLSALAAEEPAAAEARIRRLATTATLILIPVALVGVLSVEWGLPLVLGDEFAGAAPAFGPALALLPLAAAGTLVSQVSALRLRADVRVESTAAGALAFVVTAIAAVPAWGAPGATAALLAAVATGIAVGAARLGRVHGGALFLLSAAGSATILVIGLV